MPFAPVEAVAGGLAIGLAVYWNARLNGKVTGISGAFNTAITGDSLSVAFIAGLMTGGIVLKHIFQHIFPSDPLLLVPHTRILLAGCLVGVGTRLANGCTSGHGVCGLSRLSRRSLVAVLTFFCAAVQTATTFHSSRFYPAHRNSRPLSFANVKLPPMDQLVFISAVLFTAATLPLFLSKLGRSLKDERARLLRESIQYVLGLAFAAGLIISGMANAGKTVGFLDLEATNWDPSMAFVFIGALPLGFIGFRPLRHGLQPALVASHSLPIRTDIDFRLVFGSLLFGIGWGLVGLCPGPALVYFGAFPFSYRAFAFGLAMACGSVLSKAVVAGYDKWVS